jgi:hypothetical protein
MKHEYPKNRAKRDTYLVYASSIVRYQWNPNFYTARLRVAGGEWRHIGVFPSIVSASEAVLAAYNRQVACYGGARVP